MEFFDFTGLTNEEEKAQALDIITHQSSGVEFFFDYNQRAVPQSGNEDTSLDCQSVPKSSPSYLHLNGTPSEFQDGVPQQQQQQQSPDGKSYHTSASAIESQGIPSGHPAESLSAAGSQFIDWHLVNVASTISDAVITPAAALPACPTLQYIMNGAYFTPHAAATPNLYPPPLAPPHVGMATATLPVQSVPLSNQNHKDAVKQHNSSPMVSSSTTSNIKNSSKLTPPGTNCDMRPYYIPHSSHTHYSNAAALTENNHLNNAAITTEALGLMPPEPASLVASNGSVAPVAVPAPAVNHLAAAHNPYSYHPSPFAPHHTPLFPASSHFAHPGPIYFIHTADGHYIPAHYAHYPPNLPMATNNLVTSPNSSGLPELVAQSGNSHPSSGILSFTANSSAGTATLSNQSSSVSSLAAAYQQSISPSSHSATPTSFEPAEETNQPIDTSQVNDSFHYTYQSPQDNVDHLENELQCLKLEDAQVPMQLNHPVGDENSMTENLIEGDSQTESHLQRPSFATAESQVLTVADDEETPDTLISTQMQDQNVNSVNKLISKIASQLPAVNVVAATGTAMSTNTSIITNQNDPSTQVVDTQSSVYCNPSSTQTYILPSLPAQNVESTTVKESSEPKDTQDSLLISESNVITSSISASSITSSSNISVPKPSTASTWASILFSSATTNIANSSSSNVQSKSANSNESSQVTAINGEGDKSNIANGEFPELGGKNQSIDHFRAERRFFPSESSENDKLRVIVMKDDPIAFKLAARFRDSIHLKHSMPTIMPCGLVNRGNWCYVNATLQALLACPPFYMMMRDIGETPDLFRKNTSTPIIDNFARFFLHFGPSDVKKQIKSAGSSWVTYLEELFNNDHVEPVSIYDTLQHIGMIKNDAQRGHQEDAEEFLSSVLNGLHEEMIQLASLINEPEKEISANNTKTNGFGNHDGSGPFVEDTELANGNGDNLWHEVGTSKHKALPTLSAKVTTSLITEAFGGSFLDVRTVNKDNNSIGNRQPFFALQLDIKPPNINNLEDAIRWQTRREMIQGYTCSKTKQVVEASRQTFLETLPPILILHLKLFDYDIATGSNRKLLKRINFHENLEIPRECVSRNNDSRQCKRYKLLSVVYHNGPEAMKGHYIADVYHLGLNQWLRCDDASIKVIPLQHVLTGGEGNMVPYLLFYRRQDTLSNYQSSNSGSASNLNGSARSKVPSNFDHHHHQHHQHSHHHPTGGSSQHTDSSVINIHNKFSTFARHP